MPLVRSKRSNAIIVAPLLAALSLLLSACATMDEPRRPCCYTGEVKLAHVRDVYLSLDNGQRLPFNGAFPGFEARTGLIGESFPFIEADIARVTYQSLLPVLPQYDANGDGRIQEPELTVLYLREAALGLGHKVSYVGVNPRADAIVLPSGEASGLVAYVKSRSGQMTPAAQKIFQELVMLGQDLRLEAERGDQDAGQFTP